MINSADNKKNPDTASKRYVGRSGTYVKQIQGYRAFVPAPLPPNPPLKIDGALQKLLSQADYALGRLFENPGKI